MITVAHDYLSTGCLHGDQVLPDGRTGHEYCRSETGGAGLKTPGQCKFCSARCQCPCHGADGKTAVPSEHFDTLLEDGPAVPNEATRDAFRRLDETVERRD